MKHGERIDGGEILYAQFPSSPSNFQEHAANGCDMNIT